MVFTRIRFSLFWTALALFGLSFVPAMAAEVPQEWELVIPTGVIERIVLDPAPRLTSLEGKTIVLRWNGKHNGNVFLDRLAVLLGQKYPTAKIVKSYETDASLNVITGSDDRSNQIAGLLKNMKPDLVIASQAD
ncbi:MAG: hypothetical protein FWE89_02160 [Syntrophaceae bacterium]|nr:hypothetical protein [Syntrophaceae bacterium]